ncbi:MAG: IS110 family transposase [Dehalococcoidia bacterium]|nr:IS110 family transposase [Dehalococcoidia bacterium]
MVGEQHREYKQWAPSLLSKGALVTLERLASGPGDSALSRELKASVCRHAAHLLWLTRDIDALAKEIEAHSQVYAPLTEVTGVAALTAGALAGILGSHAPFASDAQLAAFAGVAPLEASSAGRGRHRLSRGGNRRLNAIVYRIAIAQLRHPGPAHTYVDRKLQLGLLARRKPSAPSNATSFAPSGTPGSAAPLHSLLRQAPLVYRSVARGSCAPTPLAGGSAGA